MHTAIGALANGTSQPSAIRLVENLDVVGIAVDVDLDALRRAERIIDAIAAEQGLEPGRPTELDLAYRRHQIPGGMMGTLRRQLTEIRRLDLLPRVLDEAGRVRAELGYPIMVTPYSQYVGSQAVMNVLAEVGGGERWSRMPDEILRYLLGHFGTPPGEIDPAVRDRAAASPRTRELDRPRPEPTADEARTRVAAALGRPADDAEVVLRSVLPADQLAAMEAAGCLLLSSQPAGHDGVALPGAVEAVRALRAAGRPIVAFTNASNRLPAEIAASLRALGFDFADDRVLTPSVVAADVVRRRFGDALVLAFGGSGLVDVLRGAGVRMVEPGDGSPVAAVVIGWDVGFDQAKIQAAADAVWSGAPLLVTSDAPAFATRGRRAAGVAGFIASGLAHVTGASYEVLGKPSALAAACAAERLGVAASRMLVAGDDLTLEVAMARRAGGIGVLVTTGMHSRRDADEAPESRRPHLVVDSLAELAEAFDARG